MKTSLQTLPLWLLSCIFFAAQTGVTAHAHSDEHLDTIQTPHGGQQRMAGPLHLELVLAKDGDEAKARAIAVYVADHAGKAIATTGARASITLLTGKAKVKATLKPDGDNRLSGSAVFTASPATKAVVTVTMPGQPVQQARFTPLATEQQAVHSHHSH
jgi:hypothetical protein